jgi:hypothetical protein
MKQYKKNINLNSERCIKTSGSLLFVGLFAVACSSSPLSSAEIQKVVNSTVSTPAANWVTEAEGYHLSNALKQNPQTKAMASERKQIIEQIARFNSARKKSAMTEAECKKKFASAPECTFLSSNWSNSLVDAAEESEIEIKKSSRGKRSQFIQKLAKHLRAGNLTALPDQHPGDYYRALKSMNQWTTELEALSVKATTSPECAPAELYNYLGLKAEEFFPGPEFREKAVALYSRLDACVNDDDPVKIANSKYVQSGRFRLGLLSMIDKKCDQARRAFTKLAKFSAGDFTTRALYWNARCAKIESNSDAFLTNYQKLFKTNPLGFHTLSINHGESVLTGNLNKPIDPIVQLRSQSQTELNLWIAVVEDLDRLKEYDAVRKMLVPFKRNPDLLGQLEPGVRLYLSTFAHRSSDRLSLFRILDSVFRTQSEYVVDSTLSLFYPLEHFQNIVGEVREVNPYLIAALIRQESAFNADAKSRVGAMGLMQLMPSTARRMDRSVKKHDLLRPSVNIRLGVRFFEYLVKRYKGDVELALAAYNAGPDAVDRWLARYPIKNKMLFLDLIPYSETRNYVTLIGRNYFWYSKIYAHRVNSELGVAQVILNDLKPSVFGAMVQPLNMEE